jgi:methylenetetrahydrofolate reductase (NADPH)
LSALIDKLNSSVPSLWLEVSAPRGISSTALLKRLAALAGHVDAINLTDNALGKIKMSGLVFGVAIKQQLKIPVVLNMSCRDRNRFALTSDLLGAAAIGIDALVALTGDKIPPEESGRTIPAHDLDVFGLLKIVAALNRGGRQSESQKYRTRIRVARAQERGRRAVRDHAAGFRG